MEVVGNSPNDYFEFNNYSRISPHLSAPSSPKRFGELFPSAPTSPSRISDFYSEFEYFSITSPTPKADDNDGFAFFIGESEKSFHSAEELFHGGRIKPLNEDIDLLESAKSPKHHKKSTIVHEKNEPRNVDNNGESESRRGRDRTPSFVSSNSGRRRVTRSHSPYMEPHHTWIEETQRESNKEDVITKASLSSMLTPKSSRKWRFRDLLLFRSASEGSGISKGSLGKYPILFKKGEEGKGNSSFSSSNNSPRSRRNEKISPHELHYARKKAETEDLKKRTFLPYKQGILGRLAGYT